MAGQCDSILLGQIPLVQSLREAGDNGTPIVLQKDAPSASYFKEIAKKLVQRVSHRHETISPTEIIEITT